AWFRVTSTAETPSQGAQTQQLASGWSAAIPAAIALQGPESEEAAQLPPDTLLISFPVQVQSLEFVAFRQTATDFPLVSVMSRIGGWPVTVFSLLSKETLVAAVAATRARP